jgi:hypothetical protein
MSPTRRRICKEESQKRGNRREGELAHLLGDEQARCVITVRLECSNNERGDANDDDDGWADEDGDASAANSEAPDRKRAEQRPNGDEDDGAAVSGMLAMVCVQEKQKGLTLRGQGS